MLLFFFYEIVFIDKWIFMLFVVIFYLFIMLDWGYFLCVCFEEIDFCLRKFLEMVLVKFF